MESTKTKVLFLTQYFPPETGAPQARIFEMAKYLQSRGFQVEVLTAMPNYPKGEIFEGYKGKLLVKEVIDEITVIRSFIYPTRKASFVHRLSNYFSFVFSSVFLGAWRVSKPDVLITESPPLFLGISGYLLKLIFRSKFVFNVSDLWPESAVRIGVVSENGILARAASHLEAFFYRRSDAQTGQSLGIIEGIKQRVETTSPVLVANGCDCTAFSPEKRDQELLRSYDLENKVVVGYAGLLGLAQGVQIILDAAKHFSANKELRFLIAGDGPEREVLQQFVSDNKLENVVFTGLMPKTQMYRLIPGMDITIIPLRYFIPGALPSKVYEAMACGVPIILPAEGDPAHLVKNADAGIVCKYNSEEVFSALEYLLTHPEERMRLGQNGRDYVLQHHDRPVVAEKMAGVIDRLTGNLASIRSQG